MNVLIISPGQRKYELKLTKKLFGFYRSTLPLLAALITEKHNVQIVDESIDGKINPEKYSHDIVCISPMTAFAPRAYKISQDFKENGAIIVMGGIHVSAMPNEALEYCDAICIGEGETVLPQIIKQIDSGGLEKRIYQSAYPDIHTEYPEPKWDLAKKSLINIIKTIDISRGCPYSCDFCSVSKFQGKKFRFRSVDSIINEITASNGKYFFLNSDNIVGNNGFAKKLFARLKELDIKWVSQSSITIASNDELLKLAKESGCYALCIGFESISQDSLIYSKKNINKVNEYIDLVKNIHDYGINIQGSFILGFDHDKKGIAQETLDFISKAKLDMAFPHILTPYPVTTLYNRLKNEGRIIATNYPSDWALYDTSHVVFDPKNMTVDELQSEYNLFLNESFSMRSIHKRARYKERDVSNLFQYTITNIFHSYKNRRILDGI